MNKAKHLLQIYYIGYEHASDDIFDYENYFSTVEEKAYQLGFSHFLQGRFSLSAKEIIKELKDETV